MPVTTESNRTQQDIAQLVRDNTSNAVTRLVVCVDDSSIRIDGEAETYYVKQLATQAALSECRGRSVQNAIHVQSR
jgi:hypothetical protein